MSREVTTVVVGHGKTPVGKGWGENIDRARRVIRMWDCQWQDPQDYGTRYDLGLFEIGHGMTAKFLRMNTKQPRDGWLASVCSSERTALPDLTTVVDQGRWNQMAMQMGGLGATGRLQFQRGVVAACWAIEDSRRAKGRGRVILVGFDNVKAGIALPPNEGFPEKYLTEPTSFHFNGYIPGAARYGNHDFTIEGPFMQRLARDYNVQLEHANEKTKW